MYKAVFTDMDGTLLRQDHTVSHTTKQAIQKLIAKGILIIPISARPLHGMLPITNNIFPEDIPVVSLNGSYIYHKGKIIYQANMPLPPAAVIHNLSEKFRVSVMYYSQMDWYAVAETAAVKKEQKITPVPITIQSFDKTIKTWEQKQTGPNKILIAGDAAVILEVEKEMQNTFNNSLNIYKSQPKYVEAMHPDASKTNAMRFIMDMYGINQNETIAIGDNYNDVGMIEFAGMGVAMGNAPADIQSSAGFITDTNNNDGVAKALSHFFK
jgi:Cof subfamily protein (haloacid dehalogenase superfamily)